MNATRNPAINRASQRMSLFCIDLSCRVRVAQGRTYAWVLPGEYLAKISVSDSRAGGIVHRVASFRRAAKWGVDQGKRAGLSARRG